MPETVLAGTPTAWRIMGNGPVQALALHCSLAHSGAWAGFAAQIPQITVTAPDMLGHGRSGDWDGHSDFHTLATRHAMAMRAQMGDGPIHVIGHSSGATIALRIALENPDGIASLTLIEPVLFAAARAANAPVFKVHWEQHTDYALALQAGDRATAAAEFQKIWGVGQPFETLPQAEQTYIIDRIGLIAAQQSTLTDDAAGMLTYGRLEALGVPVLLLQGAESPPVIDAINAELARRLPQVRRAVVAGAGHMVPITHAAECAALVQGFWAEAREPL